MKPFGITNYRLAKEIHVPPQRIGDIVAGKRKDHRRHLDLRLCRFFGLSDGWWLRLQADYDTAIAQDGLKKELEEHHANRPGGLTAPYRVAQEC